MIEDMPVRTVIHIRKDGSRDVQTFTDGESRTLQGPSADSDVNNILAKYGAAAFSSPQVFSEDVLDFSQISDYHSALNRTLEIEDMFSSLGAHIRQRFANDPAQLIHFLGDPSNRDEAVKLGLVNPLPSPSSNSQSTPSSDSKRDST